MSNQTCQVCSAKVTELRRGRCWGCYQYWVSQRPVGLGAICCLCDDRRLDHLKNVELLGSWTSICHNCSSMTMALDPMPQSVAEIRALLCRERRGGKHRSSRSNRVGKNGQRRAIDRFMSENQDEMGAVEDEMIVEVRELAADVGVVTLDDSWVELIDIPDSSNSMSDKSS